MRKAFLCCVCLIGQLSGLGCGSPPPSPPKAGTESGAAPKPRVAEQPQGEKRATEEEIKKLIATFAEIEHPYIGLSPSLSGRAFAPVPGSERMGVMRLTDHGLKTPEPLKRLVQLGPDALPYLLQALDDKTPTKLKIEPKGMNNLGFPGDGQPYTVKVGDVCYVALGQIVGRPYQCVGYIPTGTICIGSPVEDKELLGETRAEWAHKDCAAQLRDMLLKDYRTTPVFNGENLNGWYPGSNLQIEAVMRLLCYYPKEAVPLVAARLRSFDVADAPREGDEWMLREVRNGVRTAEFIEAVAWCEHPDIRSALADIAKRTNDKEIAEALGPPRK
jgi:hypothetical protein